MLIFINKVRTKTFTHQSPSAETYQIIQSFPHALVCPPRSTARVMREYAKIDLYIGLSKHSMDQSTNCVWHFWETANHSPHESTAICNQRSWRYSESCGKITGSPNTSGTFKEAFPWRVCNLQGLKPTNCWNTRCHHQDPRICQHFNWLAKLAPKTKGWHPIEPGITPTSVFWQTERRLPKNLPKRASKNQPKKTRYANTPSQNLSCVHHNNILEDICTRPLSHMDLHLPLPNFHPDATRLHKARLIGDLPPATCSGCKDRHDAECAVRNVRSSTERRRRSMFDFWHNDICFPNDRKSWGHPQSFPVSVIACKRLAA